MATTIFRFKTSPLTATALASVLTLTLLVPAARASAPFQVDAGPIGPDGYGGILDALQGGYWVMLRPLSPGPHRISFGATAPLVDGNTGEPVGGTLDLTAKLRLEAANPN